MLRAHLNPDHPGSSRAPSFMDRSARWIASLVPPDSHPLLLDLGCGPGLYAERFTRLGYRVTGVDLSPRSIRYAKDAAQKNQHAINYRCENYLQLQLSQRFDFATMIYCDYGALSTNDRRTLMRTAYNHLRPGGKFLLDVFSLEVYRSFTESQTWEVFENGGFWYPGPHLVLHAHVLYPPATTLEQATILTDVGATTYHIWSTYFSADSLCAEAEVVGFRCAGVWSDVAGTPYHPTATTLALLLERP